LVVKNRKHKSAERPGSTGMVSGVAWYRAEQWPRLLETSVDRLELERTYDEWHAMATEGLAELARAGVWPQKVDVDVDEMVEWCRTRGRPVDAAARAQFVALKVKQADDGQAK
jgi:hypothetical protein